MPCGRPFSRRGRSRQVFTVRVPRYSYQQLQDNREWNWKILDWWFAAPILQGQRTCIQFTTGQVPGHLPDPVEQLSRGKGRGHERFGRTTSAGMALF